MTQWWAGELGVDDDVFASLCTSDHLSEGGDTGHTERKAHHDQHEDGEPELTEHTKTFHRLLTDLCFNVTNSKSWGIGIQKVRNECFTF